jgi:hypothetical protein
MRRLRRRRHHDNASRPDADGEGMTSKGKQYSTIVRRAGLAALQEGITLATANGDMEVMRILQQDLERYQRAAAGEDLDLSR